MSKDQKTLVNTKTLSRIAILGFCFFTGLLGASQTALATDSTLTITLSENAVTADVAPLATSSGTFVQSSGMTIEVSTDHISGYILSISAGDTTTPSRLKNGSSYLQSITTPTTLNNFKNADLSNSDLATSLGLSDCTQITESSNCKGIWGYKPSKLNSSVNGNFLPSPGTNGNTIDQTNEANATANNYTVTLGAKVSPFATVGTYTNTFIVTATGNPIPYTFSYYENIASNMPADSSNTSGSTTVNLSNTAPTRAGFKFGGWCDQATTKDGEYDVCATGHIYQPGAPYTLDATGTVNNIKLYAIWQEVCAGYTTMQSLTSSSIATLLPNEHSTATVCDVRDEQTYTIAKLKDGKYWMVENLNLAGGTALDADKTDVDASYISSFSTSNNLTKDTTDNTIVLPASSISGFSTDNYAYVYNSGNKTNCGASGQNTTPCYSYYSWDAATLGSGRSISTDNTDAPYSICPKGWKLPTTYDGSGTVAEATDFRALMIGYGGSNSIQTYNSSTTPTGATMYGNIGPGTTPNFLLAGHHRSYGLGNGGSFGYYWSATSYSSTSDARYLSFSSSSVNSVDNYNRRYGFSVRCLFSGQ